MRQDKGIEHVLFTGDVTKALLGTIRSPGWKYFQHYLRSKRALETQKLIYTWRLPQHEQEITTAQARIKFIDEILGDTDEASLKLASDIADQLGQPTNPYKVD